MTVNSSLNKIQYVGTGGVTLFPFPYPFELTSDIVTTVVDTSVTPNLDITSSFTFVVAGGLGDVGTVTITPAPSTVTATNRITIKRTVSPTQLTSYPESGPFPAKAHEKALDKLTELCQQIIEAQGRAITLSPNSAAVTTPFIADLIAGLVLMVDPTATNIIMGPSASQISNAQSYAVIAQAAAAIATAAAATANYLPQRLNQAKHRAALGKVKAKTQDEQILWIGDSTTLGYGSSGTTLAMRYSGLINKVSDLFNENGVPSVANGFYGDGGGHGGGSLSTLYDNRIAVGSWLETGAIFAGGASFTCTTTTASPLTFTPGTNIDTFVIYWFRNGSGGTFSYAVNGGAATNVSTSGGAGIFSTVVTGTLAQINQIALKYVSGGQIYVLGFDAYDSSKKQIRHMNAGWLGGTTGDISSIITEFGVTNTLQLGQNLTMICLGINDGNTNVPLTTFQSNLQAIITAALAAGDVCLMTFPPQNPATQWLTNPYGGQDAYVAAIRALAVSNNINCIDLYSRWVSYTLSNSLGNYIDNIHPNAVGYSDWAQAVWDIIGSSSSDVSTTSFYSPSVAAQNVLTSQVNSGQLAGMRNRVINGDMRVKQKTHLTGATTITVDNTYVIDRFLSASSQA